MGGFYPEAADGLSVFDKIISEEYERFNDTVVHGIKILEEKITELKDKKQKTVPGDFIFKLYDEKGFPVDIAIDMAEENGFSVDLKTYDELMELQKKGSKQKKEKNGVPETVHAVPIDITLTLSSYFSSKK